MMVLPQIEFPNLHASYRLGTSDFDPGPGRFKLGWGEAAAFDSRLVYFNSNRCVPCWSKTLSGCTWANTREPGSVLMAVKVSPSAYTRSLINATRRVP